MKSKIDKSLRQTIVPKNLEDAAIIRGMDLSDVAEKMGWPKEKIVRINDGRLKPSQLELRQLGLLLNVPYGYWFAKMPELEGPIFICRQSGDN